MATDMPNYEGLVTLYNSGDIDAIGKLAMIAAHTHDRLVALLCESSNVDYDNCEGIDNDGGVWFAKRDALLAEIEKASK